MDDLHNAADEQARLWNGPAGHAWVESQALLDRLLQPFADLIVDAVAARGAHHVLDVGCGAGATTLAIARLLGTRDAAVGIDISEPLIAAARARADRERTPAEFICANAQSHPLEPGRFDLIVSRFGVMFFDDPVAAFANLRRGVRDGGGLSVIAWRSATENPFMTTAERAAAPLLPDLPPRKPNAPGQFAWGDPQRVRAILSESGWTGVDVRPIDVPCALPEDQLVSYVTRLGPVGMALQEADATTRARVTAVVRAAFEPFVQSDEVRFTGACWMVSAASVDRAGAHRV
jgi:SAM-dependent methyltransferase